MGVGDDKTGVGLRIADRGAKARKRREIQEEGNKYKEYERASGGKKERGGYGRVERR